MQSFFSGHLLKLFDEKSTPSPSAEPAAVDDWADVAVDNRTGNAGVVELPQRHLAPTHISPSFDMIPDVETVSRPDELLLKPPYHLIVYGGGKTFMEVQCSHSPTLQFLSDYLIKWSRTNHNNTTRVKFPSSTPQPAHCSVSFNVTDTIPIAAPVRRGQVTSIGIRTWRRIRSANSQLGDDALHGANHLTDDPPRSDRGRARLQARFARWVAMDLPERCRIQRQPVLSSIDSLGAELEVVCIIPYM
ncbi:hypothetical protein O1611_g10149 [Lasiodiplodia mahajangana]|uniref:Uncharacterized protein n=1 Tax=Lasiodiplodia mahajangana TaxID=1108764 RepID=A0ACC2J1B2_9PEZI|nr:hypothetical protein O1611_g10149 [Lasiodiplodia mahajangana]